MTKGDRDRCPVKDHEIVPGVLIAFDAACWIHASPDRELPDLDVMVRTGEPMLVLARVGGRAGVLVVSAASMLRGWATRIDVRTSGRLLAGAL